MAYVARSHYSTGGTVTSSDYNQGMDNEIELAIGGVSIPFNNDTADIEVDTSVIFDVPHKVEVNRVRLFAGSVDAGGGTIAFDIQKTTYSSFDGSAVPGTAESMCGTVYPEFSGSHKYEDSTLTSWSPAIAAGDIMKVIVTDCDGVKQCTLSLKWSRD